MDGVRNILRRMVDPQIRIDDLEGLESLSKQRSSIITTVAPWQIWYALHRDGYLERLLGSDHYLVDGNGIVAALRVAGAGSVPRFTGREAAQAVYEGRLWADSNVAVLGGSERSHDVLRRTHPNWLVFGGEFSDRPAESKVESVVEFFKTAGIDRVLLGLGTPKQEIWMELLAKSYPATYIGVGGSFEVATRQISGPSRLAITLKLEWLQRLSKRPRVLFPKQVQATSVMPRIMMESFSIRRQQPP